MIKRISFLHCEKCFSLLIPPFSLSTVKRLFVGICLYIGHFCIFLYIFLLCYLLVVICYPILCLGVLIFQNIYSFLQRSFACVSISWFYHIESICISIYSHFRKSFWSRSSNVAFLWSIDNRCFYHVAYEITWMWRTKWPRNWCPGTFIGVILSRENGIWIPLKYPFIYSVKIQRSQNPNLFSFRVDFM